MIPNGTIFEVEFDIGMNVKHRFYEVLDLHFDRKKNQFAYDCIICSKTGKRFKKHELFEKTKMDKVFTNGMLYEAPRTWRVYFSAPATDCRRNHKECYLCQNRKVNPPVCNGHCASGKCPWLVSNTPNYPSGEYATLSEKK